jgi:hypothetical protein
MNDLHALPFLAHLTVQAASLPLGSLPICPAKAKTSKLPSLVLFPSRPPQNMSLKLSCLCIACC